jgi:hypothetical protein
MDMKACVAQELRQLALTSAPHFEDAAGVEDRAHQLRQRQGMLLRRRACLHAAHGRGQPCTAGSAGSLLQGLAPPHAFLSRTWISAWNSAT